MTSTDFAKGRGGAALGLVVLLGMLVNSPHIGQAQEMEQPPSSA